MRKFVLAFLLISTLGGGPLATSALAANSTNQPDAMMKSGGMMGSGQSSDSSMSPMMGMMDQMNKMMEACTKMMGSVSSGPSTDHQQK